MPLFRLEPHITARSSNVRGKAYPYYAGEAGTVQQAGEMEKNLLTYDQVDERLGVSKRTVIYLKEGREIDFVKVGRLVRFTEDAVRKFIERNTHKAIPR